uniref:Synaptophysin-like 1 n=1 Tax=Astyanax mexicanus TaxID=7994 RepID=A0A8B9HXP1_ASTMX
ALEKTDCLCKKIRYHLKMMSFFDFIKLNTFIKWLAKVFIPLNFFPHIVTLQPQTLNQVRLVEGNVSLCNHTSTETHLVGDSSSSAEFFVAVAVLAFLYSMAALLVYVGYMHVYRDSDFGPMFDFVVTAAFAFLWLVSSSAWARGLQVVKYATGTEGIASTLLPCRDAGVTCEVTEFTSMRTLNISVVFGFLNLIVWAGNAWFVYKETRWHSQKVNSQPAAGRGPGPAPI